jgi:hypothetical protein
MKKTLTLCLISGFTVLLSACGGGGSETSNVYGSIAFNSPRADAGIATGFPTQADADFRAIQNCGNTQTCKVVSRFSGAGQCAAVAFSVNGAGGIMSYGVESTKTSAETSALRNCVLAGGNYCELWKYACQ